MIIDTFLEWFVIGVGCVIALSVLFPRPVETVGKKIMEAIPHPSGVAKWLRDHGM